MSTEQNQYQNVLPEQEALIRFERVQLAIPAGAVSEPVEISIEKLAEVDELNPGLDNTTGEATGYRFKPDGQQFLKPVEVTLPYDRSALPEEVYTFFYNTAQKCWEQLERIAVDTAQCTVTSLTTHFTDMINGVLTLPAAAKPLSFNPTSIKDIKAADPGAGINLINPPQASGQGNAGLSYPIEIPPGRNGMQPQLAVQYNSDGQHGWMGLGWDIPSRAITIDTRWGVPRYSTTHETETYSLDGVQMTPMAHRGALKPRAAEKTFRARLEGSFNKIVRHGDSPANYWWEVTDKQGTRYFYGGTPETGLKPSAVLYGGELNNIFKWALIQMRDTNGNTIDYEYAKVSDSGVGNGDGAGAVLGTQLYLKTITYTGSNGTPGLYAVHFIRDRELLEPRRSDVSIDARAGFKVVTADLLRKIEVKFQDQSVRSYEFEYQEGAFKKTLLTDVVQYGQDGAEFNRHTFTYYDEVRSGDSYQGFAASAEWSIGEDGVGANLGGQQDASALGGSIADTDGWHLYVGIGVGKASKSNSAGFKTGGSNTDNEDLIAFIDLNGNGLPDKVFKKDGTIWYRPNNGPSDAPDFGQPVALNISSISRESSSTSSFGAENYIVVSGMANKSHTFTSSNVYFSDVNGDGLPDLVADGYVYFNRLVNGVPTFVLNDSEGTPVPVSPARVDTEQLVQDFTAEYNEMLDASPLMDALRVWKAPFNGHIAITAPVHLMAADRGTYQTADGVRVAIQHNGSELWAASIGADDYTLHTPSGLETVPVQKGDRIYFRVSSVFDGAFDAVEWGPEVTYLNVDATLTDANVLTPYRYKATQDFAYVGRGGELQTPITGTVRIKGNLEKTGAISDDIQVVVYKNNAVVANHTINANETGLFILQDDIEVAQEDSLKLKLVSDSPIDLTRVVWTPDVYYVAAVDPTIQLTDAEGNPTIHMPGLYDSDIYITDDASPNGSWVATQTGVLTVVPQLSLTDGLLWDGMVTFTVKKPNELVAKTNIVFVDGVPQNLSPLTVNITQGDILYFDFSARDQQLSGNVTHSVTAYFVETDTIAVPNGFHCAAVPSPNSLPQLYRAWGYVAYNGNRDRYAAPINEADLNIGESYGKEAVPNVFVMLPEPKKQRWSSQDADCWITAGGMSATRCGNKYIAMPTAVNRPESRGINRIGKSSQFTTSLGYGYATVSTANGDSYGELDFIDMNGDGFPDVVGNGRIQYSTPTGGLEDFNTPVSGFIGKIRESRNYAEMGGIGGNPPSMMPNAFGKADGSVRGVFKRLMAPLGINYNAVDNNWAHGAKELIDLNGDGLPDQVWLDGENIKVSLNLGYGFAESEVWGTGAIQESTNVNAPLSASLGLGFNKDNYEYGGGLSFTQGKSLVNKQFMDINGDGLPDMVVKTDTGMTVAFNTGNGFTPFVQWHGALSRPLVETCHKQMNGGLYFSIYIPIGVILPIFLVINPGADFGKSVGRREAAIVDINGDGLPDFVESTDDGTMTVALNRVGLTNKLKSVSRPLGASFELFYHREGNTYDMPHKRWVLSKVVLQDGHTGDGADTQVVTFKYSDGKYDRLEREFYGFRKVVAEYLDPADNSLLKSVITSYLINSYYTKGMVESVETKDGNGQPFLRTVNTYRLWDVETGTNLVDVYPANTIATVFPQLVRSDKYFHEGQAVAGVDTYETYEYDAYGNATRYFQAGNLGANDDVEAVITYHQDLSRYIVGKPSSTRVSGNGTLMRHREADYDAAGNQTELRQYLENGQIRTTNFTYYPNGTLQQVTSPANLTGQRYAVSLVYDPLVGAYVTQITDSFGYSSTATYNYLYGVEASATDLNGNVMSKNYDNFGRLNKVFSPYDGTIPAAAFAYYPNELPARAVTQNKLYFDPANSETLDTVLFTDGLKRVIQTKKEAEVLLHGAGTPSYGMTVSGKTLFDTLGCVVQQGQPVFETGYATAFYDLPLKNPTATQYDVLDRATLVTLPDNSTMQTVYAIENSQFKTTVTDPEGKVRHSYADVRGNTVKTVQFNDVATITTTYQYDPLSEIIKVIDNNGNITQMTYDLVGQRTALNNPDRGLVEYTYDLAGNLVKKVDGNLRSKAQAINYVYEYNRLQKIDYPESIDVEYFYGAPGASDNRVGRLYRTTDASGITESFFGKLGEAVKTVRTMNFLVPGHEPWTFTTESGYDYLGRVQWLTYPDGEKLIYVYDQGGLIKAAYGERQTDHYDYVKQIAYDEFGQRVYIKYGNNIETRYTYDPYRRWLDNINTGNGLGGTLQNMHYTFDKVGNVLGLENKAQHITQSFQYDDLYQLVRAEGTGPDKHKNKHKANHYIQTFSYDTIGNMTQKTSYNQITPGNHMPKELNFDFTYLYSGTKPHAPSQIENWVYQYDDNGNTVVKSRLTGAPTGESIPGGGTSGEYFWDEENRLILAKVNGMSTDYLYDGGGTCTVKRGPGGETLYVSQFYQLQNRQRVTKHFFVGPTRVVSKLSHYNNPNGLYDSGYEKKNIYTYHPDHLGSSNYITDPVGKQFEHLEYTPYGETWIDDGTNLNIIDYRFTSKELDKHTGLYYYGARYLDPQNSRWLSPDPILDKYLPEMPVDDEAKKRNQKLPGIGGVFNPVNLGLFCYAANNPVKYVDPNGETPDFPFSGPWSENEIWKLVLGGYEGSRMSDETFLHYYKQAIKDYSMKEVVPGGITATQNIFGFASKVASVPLLNKFGLAKAVQNLDRAIQFPGEILKNLSIHYNDEKYTWEQAVADAFKTKGIETIADLSAEGLSNYIAKKYNMDENSKWLLEQGLSHVFEKYGKKTVE